MSEQVDHPKHYGGKDNHYEAIKVIEAWGLDFCLGNAVKYISRAGKKESDKTIHDLEKAKWYIERRIAQLNPVDGVSFPKKFDFKEWEGKKVRYSELNIIGTFLGATYRDWVKGKKLCGVVEFEHDKIIDVKDIPIEQLELIEPAELRISKTIDFTQLDERKKKVDALSKALLEFVEALNKSFTRR